MDTNDTIDITEQTLIYDTVNREFVVDILEKKFTKDIGEAKDFNWLPECVREFYLKALNSSSIYENRNFVYKKTMKGNNWNIGIGASLG